MYQKGLSTLLFNWLDKILTWTFILALAGCTFRPIYWDLDNQMSKALPPIDVEVKGSLNQEINEAVQNIQRQNFYGDKINKNGLRLLLKSHYRVVNTNKDLKGFYVNKDLSLTLHYEIKDENGVMLREGSVQESGTYITTSSALSNRETENVIRKRLIQSSLERIFLYVAVQKS